MTDSKLSEPTENVPWWKLEGSQPNIDPVQLATETANLRSRILACTACKLHECSTQRVPFRGSPPAIMSIIGEAPGPTEDREGRPFIGASGKLLDQLMGEVFGFTSQDCVVFNAVQCWPNVNGKTKKPMQVDAKSLDACRPHLLNQIALADSPYLLLLGQSALDAFRPGLNIGQMHGRPMHWNGRTLLISYHPAYALYQTGVQRLIRVDFSWFNDLLREPDLYWPDHCPCGTTEIERADDWGVYWCERCWPRVPHKRG